MHLGTMLDPGSEHEKLIAESELDKERLDKEYRQTNYLDGYEETHQRLKNEMAEIIEENLDKYIDIDYIFSVELGVTNVGYQIAEENNLGFWELFEDYPETISRMYSHIAVYDDCSEIGDDLRAAYKIVREHYSMEEKDDLFYMFDGKLETHVIIIDTSLLHDKKILTGYQENHKLTFYNDYLDGNDAFRFLYTRTEINELELQDKYKEEFIRLGYYKLIGADDSANLFAPKRNLNIVFEKDGEKDTYKSSIFQYLMSERMEKLLDKYELRDTIGYFLAAENVSNRGNTTGIEFTDDQLGDMYDTLNITLYYLLEPGEEEDKDILVKLLRDIYKDTDSVTLMSVVIYVHEIETRDKQIALKLLDEAKLSQMFLERKSGMDTWLDQWKRVRNDADAFKFLDNYSERRDYLYNIYYYVDEKFNVESLMRNKVNSRFE